MNKSTQENPHPWQRLKHMVRALPVLGDIANWLYGIVNLNAVRRQNAHEHAHFLALHQILEAQHANLLQQLEQQQHRHAQTQQQCEQQGHLLQQYEERRAAVQLHTEQDLAHLRLQLEQATIRHQLQLAELRTQHEKALQDIVQHTAQLDEQGLQADIATDMLAQRVAGLTKLLRQRNSTDESIKN